MESGSRTEMEERVTKLGADVDRSISENTDYLVCGHQVTYNATNAKFKKAKN